MYNIEMLKEQTYLGVAVDNLPDNDLFQAFSKQIIDYIHPVKFENLIKQIDPKLWRVEFKKSIALIFSLLLESKFINIKENRRLFERLIEIHEVIANLYLDSAEYTEYCNYCYELHEIYEEEFKKYFGFI